MYELNSNAGDKATSNTPTGDFVNRNLLRIDPKSGMASRFNIAGPGENGSSTTANGPSFAQKLAALGDMGAATGKSTPNSVDDPKQKVQQYTTPTQYLDARGKTLPQYRMGIGHRILGTLANFANGFAGNRAQPIYVGPGALNNRYYQDERQREQNLDAAQQELWGYQGPANKYRDAVDWRTIGREMGTGKWIGRTYGGERRELGTPPWAVPDDDEEDTGDQSQVDSPEPGPAPMRSGRPGRGDRL